MSYVIKREMFVDSFKQRGGRMRDIDIAARKTLRFCKDRIIGCPIRVALRGTWYEMAFRAFRQQPITDYTVGASCLTKGDEPLIVRNRVIEVERGVGKQHQRFEWGRVSRKSRRRRYEEVAMRAPRIVVGPRHHACLAWIHVRVDDRAAQVTRIAAYARPVRPAKNVTLAAVRATHARDRALHDALHHPGKRGIALP